MDAIEQVERVKKLKTVGKYIRIASTVFKDTAKLISEDGVNDYLAQKLNMKADTLDEIVNNYEDGIIEGFKSAYKMPGCQLTLDFGN